MERVGHDATDESGGKHHSIGLLLIKELLHCLLVGQVEFFVRTANQVVVTSLLEIIPDCRAHKSVMSGNVNLAVF